MDVLRDLGALALGSRFKRLADRLMQDGIRVYRDAGLDFEPKWFPVYYYLSSEGPTAVTDIAKGLGITHPSVNQVAKEMIAANLVGAYKDRKDKRKRVLALTSHGKDQLKNLAPVWKDITSALQELVDETQIDFLGYIETLERALDTKDFHQRFLDRHRPASDEVEIVNYSPALKDTFKTLNEAWILEHFEMEEADRKFLDDPKGYVIDTGGEILFARDRATGEILGTCALVNRAAGAAELAKMTVTAAARGQRRFHHRAGPGTHAIAHHRAGALEGHHASQSGGKRGGGPGSACRIDRIQFQVKRRGQPLELARVRREHARRTEVRGKVRRGGQGVERIRIHHHRHVHHGHQPQHHLLHGETLPQPRPQHHRLRAGEHGIERLRHLAGHQFPAAIHRQRAAGGTGSHGQRARKQRRGHGQRAEPAAPAMAPCLPSPWPPAPVHRA